MLPMQFSSKSNTIRTHIERFKPWIEEQLGAGDSDILQLRFRSSMTMIVVAKLLPSVQFCDAEIGWGKTLSERLQRVELPPGCIPAVSLNLFTDRDKGLSSGKKHWGSDWLDCPVALRLQGLDRPVILMNIPFIEGASGAGEWREVVLLHRQSADEFLKLVKESEEAAHGPTVRDQHGQGRAVTPTDWDTLVLDKAATRLLRDDYQSFFEREQWFKKNGLPFRRGYLLYGPPGNGKTSAIKAMLSRPGLTGFSINLFREGIDDGDVTDLFDAAAASAPSVIVLEDIDRYFSQKTEKDQGAKVSLQHLLNCLDGATTRGGVIVVATANDPQVLDTAILRRPGRFDRVVGFPNPSKELRARYFQNFNPDFESASLEMCADATDGFSFAQLQEAYIFAGQLAFDEQRMVDVGDIGSAIEALRKSLQCADWKGEGASGFRLDRR
jgi:hypothetical protein